MKYKKLICIQSFGDTEVLFHSWVERKLFSKGKSTSFPIICLLSGRQEQKNSFVWLGEWGPFS